MAKVFNQKIKILYLMQMLSEQTDESHVISMQDILKQLEEKEIRAERKSIYDDFEVLRKFGMDICFRKSQPSGYYLANRTFKVGDVEYLINLILQGDDKEEELKKQLIEKLKGQLSVHQAELLAELQKSDSEEPVAEDEDKREEIQLLFKEKHMEAVTAHPDCIEEAKEHKPGVYKIWMNTVVDKNFYGWMVSLGFGIKIVKPKAAAEAYRAHLKKLVKQYK